MAAHRMNGMNCMTSMASEAVMDAGGGGLRQKAENDQSGGGGGCSLQEDIPIGEPPSRHACT
jgi:hypothetical protein